MGLGDVAHGRARGGSTRADDTTTADPAGCCNGQAADGRDAARSRDRATPRTRRGSRWGCRLSLFVRRKPQRLMPRRSRAKSRGERPKAAEKATSEKPGRLEVDGGKDRNRKSGRKGRRGRETRASIPGPAVTRAAPPQPRLDPGRKEVFPAYLRRLSAGTRRRGRRRSNEKRRAMPTRGARIAASVRAARALHAAVPPMPPMPPSMPPWPWPSSSFLGARQRRLPS